ncbi:hypothetical protein WICMUC_000987 [Wickerhamomyces mucosus]|uniref:Brl1/Brr6 domain-containing protein n=1 Tax=Wickerhamomyces mucosus TaxID=1378264 RepID=A0A9P8PVY4_9ASCO|nr:hypothetical protein WICMUC_000987 [Wickerhamomyces mucosus]
MPLSSISPTKERTLDEMFKQNHILSQRNKELLPASNETPLKSNTSNPFNDSFNSLISGNFATLSPITHKEVEKNPETPHFRKQYQDGDFNTSFSPVTTTTKKQFDDEFIASDAQRYNLVKRSVTNRLQSLSNFSREQLEGISTPTSKSESKLVPSSILKTKVTYDAETSAEMVKRKPELAAVMNSKGEINPMKSLKSVSFSPEKDRIHSFKSIPSDVSSPLTDSINGKKSKRGFRSPYLKIEPRKLPPKDSEWIDDEQDDEDAEHRQKHTRKSKRSRKKNDSWRLALDKLFDPQLPYILSLYLQLFFNVIIVSILLYFVYSFISTVRADVENKVDSYATDILQEIALCTREYHRNHCQPGQRVVALEAACSKWEKCMNRDPTTVGRAKIGAETFAEIINGFIKPISWKSMFFLLLITVGSLVLTNAAFGTYRNYTHYDQDQKQAAKSSQKSQTPNQNPLLQTPHHTPYQQLQYNPAYTRYYTPKASSPTNALVKHKSRSSKKSSKR